MSDMETMSYDLLSCEDHLDVTFILEDGELKSSKFLLAARSEYFATMFKNDNFKESCGVVKFPCKKVFMDTVIGYLYGAQLECSKMSLEQKLELFNIFRMVLVEDSMDKLEDEIFYTPIKDKGFANVESLVAAAKTLEATLKLNLEISKRIVYYMGTRMKKIIQILKEYNVALSNSVILALASGSYDEIEKFRFVKHYWNTTFTKENIPNINLYKLTAEQLEKEVAPSGLFEENKVLKAIIQRQKAKRNHCHCGYGCTSCSDEEY